MKRTVLMALGALVGIGWLIWREDPFLKRIDPIKVDHQGYNFK